MARALLLLAAAAAASSPPAPHGPTFVFPDGMRRAAPAPSENVPAAAAAFFATGLPSAQRNASLAALRAHLATGFYRSYVGLGEWYGAGALFACAYVDRVVAVEPDPLAHAVLAAALAANPECQLKTDADGVCIDPAAAGELALLGGGGGDALIEPLATRAQARAHALAHPGLAPQRVPCEPLPALLARHRLDPATTLVKVDIGGAEWAVLPGLLPWLAALRGARPALVVTLRALAGGEGEGEGEGEAAALAASCAVLRLYKFGHCWPGEEGGGASALTRAMRTPAAALTERALRACAAAGGEWVASDGIVLERRHRLPEDAQQQQQKVLLLQHPEARSLQASASFNPSFAPSSSPFATSFGPSYAPTGGPSFSPSFAPSFASILQPSGSYAPSASPLAPSPGPTYFPSASPSFAPTSAPSYMPSFSPSSAPPSAPSYMPSFTPSFVPTFAPSAQPSGSYAPSGTPPSSASPPPTYTPTPSPTATPTGTLSPGASPSVSSSPSAASLSPSPTPAGAGAGGGGAAAASAPAASLDALGIAGVSLGGLALLCFGALAAVYLARNAQGVTLQLARPAGAGGAGAGSAGPAPGSALELPAKQARVVANPLNPASGFAAPPPPPPQTLPPGWVKHTDGSGAVWYTDQQGKVHWAAPGMGAIV